MAEEELQYDTPNELKLRERPHKLTTVFIKNHLLPMRPKPSIWERIFTTTYTTLDATGVPGDKMSREYEKAVFA